jgi:hypothetical protein
MAAVITVTAGLMAGVMIMAASAFACIPIAVLRLTPTDVAPGGTVNALIREVSGSAVPPVTFHWKTVDGPVLATVQPGDSSTTATFSIPTDTPGGDYLVWASQPLKVYPKGQYPTWGMPVKASLHGVTPSGPPALFAGDAAVQTEIRTPALVAKSRSGLGPVEVVIIALVTAVVALALVALVARSGSKRTTSTATATDQ